MAGLSTVWLTASASASSVVRPAQSQRREPQGHPPPPECSALGGWRPLQVAAKITKADGWANGASPSASG